MASHVYSNGVEKLESKYPSVKVTLLKQLGVIRLMNILHTKGSLPIVLLGSLFATRASDGEKHAVGIGWKLEHLLATLHEFPYLFKVTADDTGHRVELNNNQQNEKVEASLALASGCLKLRDYLEIHRYSTIAEMYGLLHGTNVRRTWGETLTEFNQTIGSLPDIFCVDQTRVTLVDVADDSQEFPDASVAYPREPRPYQSFPSIKHDLNVIRQRSKGPDMDRHKEPPSKRTQFWMNEAYRDVKINGICNLNDIQRVPHLYVTLRDIMVVSYTTQESSFVDSYLLETTDSPEESSLPPFDHVTSDMSVNVDMVNNNISNEELVDHHPRVVKVEVERNEEDHTGSLGGRENTTNPLKGQRVSSESESNNALDKWEQTNSLGAKENTKDLNNPRKEKWLSAESESDKAFDAVDNTYVKVEVNNARHSPKAIKVKEENVSDGQYDSLSGMNKIITRESVHRLSSVLETTNAFNRVGCDRIKVEADDLYYDEDVFEPDISGAPSQPPSGVIAKTLEDNPRRHSRHITLDVEESHLNRDNTLCNIKQEPIEVPMGENIDETTSGTTLGGDGTKGHNVRQTTNSDQMITDYDGLKKMFDTIKEYLKSNGATIIFHLSGILFGSESQSSQALSNIHCRLLKHRLDKETDTFYVARSFAEPEDTIVCLKEQKTHLETTIDTTVAYLLEKEGTCNIQDLQTLLDILPDETKKVVARTPACLKETIKGLEGVEFRIERDRIVLCNYERWKLLVAKQLEELKQFHNESTDSNKHDMQKPEESEGTPTAPKAEVNCRIANSWDPIHPYTAQQEKSRQNGNVSGVIDSPCTKSISDSSGLQLQHECQITNMSEKVLSARKKKRNWLSRAAKRLLNRSRESKCGGSPPNLRLGYTIHQNELSLGKSAGAKDSIICQQRADDTRIAQHIACRSADDANVSGKRSPSTNLGSVSTSTQVLNSIEAILKVDGVRTVNQLVYTLRRSFKLDSILSLRDIINNDAEQRFHLIQPPNFRCFILGQAIVCLERQVKIFWSSMSWVEDYLKRNGGSCRFSLTFPGTIKGMLDMMPYYMTRLFDNQTKQLWTAVFAAANRRFLVKDGRLTLLKNPLILEDVESHTSRREVSSLSTPVSSVPASREHTKMDAVDAPDLVAASAPSRSSQKASIPDACYKHQNSVHTRPVMPVKPTALLSIRITKPLAETYKVNKSRKRKATGSGDLSKHNKAKKRKTYYHRGTALNKLQYFLACKGPRTCEQMFTFIRTSVCDTFEEQTALGKNPYDLFKIIQSSEEFHILKLSDIETDPKTSLVCLPHQRYHFETGVNEVIEHLKRNGGECLLNPDSFKKLVQLMPSDTALGKGQAYFEQTLARLCGTYFKIEGNKLFLLDK